MVFSRFAFSITLEVGDALVLTKKIAVKEIIRILVHRVFWLFVSGADQKIDAIGTERILLSLKIDSFLLSLSLFL